MKNVLKKMLLICMLFISIKELNAQLSQHGLILNGGTGRVASDVNPGPNSNQNWAEFEYILGVSAGYRFRYKIPEPRCFHFDINVQVGQKFLKVTYYDQYKPDDNSNYGYGNHAFASVGGMANFSINKNIIVGLGADPTYYSNRLESDKNLDIPIVAKVVYNFRFLEIGITGNYGFRYVMRNMPLYSTPTSYMYSVKLREIQLSLFIPFKTRRNEN